jgi:hypothetical protein
MAKRISNTHIQRKRTKGKCSNVRGITVSSNFGKIFERIINERAKQVTDVSDAQAGGKEKRSTTDHLLVLKELIREQKRKKALYTWSFWTSQKLLTKHG